jgi:glutamate-1-semialdehyde 2,1-aminomutase
MSTAVQELNGEIETGIPRDKQRSKVGRLTLPKRFVAHAPRLAGIVLAIAAFFAAFFALTPRLPAVAAPAVSVPKFVTPAEMRAGSLLTVFFRAEPPTNAAQAMTSDREAYARFFRAMLDQGVLLPPSQFEAWFVSMAHGRDEIKATLAAAKTAFAA